MKDGAVDTKKFVLIGGAIILTIAVFDLWYVIASSYDYRDLSGTYVFHGIGEDCVLALRSDGTFSQEISSSGEIRKSQGSWHRYGEAHVSFSKEFITLPGEEVMESGQAHGEFRKMAGIFPRLALAPLPGGPILPRKLLH